MEKTIFEKITLTSKNPRYLGSGQSVMCLILQGCDTNVFAFPLYEKLNSPHFYGPFFS